MNGQRDGCPFLCLGRASLAARCYAPTTIGCWPLDQLGCSCDYYYYYYYYLRATNNNGDKDKSNSNNNNDNDKKCDENNNNKLNLSQLSTRPRL